MTISLAQIRYALNHLDQFLNLIINFAIIIVIYFILIYPKRKHRRKNQQFNLIGTKGGKSNVNKGLRFD